MDNDYYGRQLTRMEVADLRHDAEDSFLKLYNAMFDQIALLEERVRLLERKNRELRGRLGE
jgi:hypothetical protein